MHKILLVIMMVKIFFRGWRGIGSASHSSAREVLGLFMFGGIKGQQRHDILGGNDDDNHNQMAHLRTGQRLALKKCKFGSEITLTQK